MNARSHHIGTETPLDIYPGRHSFAHSSSASLAPLDRGGDPLVAPHLPGAAPKSFPYPHRTVAEMDALVAALVKVREAAGKAA